MYGICSPGASDVGDDIPVHVALLIHLSTGKVVHVHLLIGEDWKGGGGGGGSIFDCSL